MINPKFFFYEILLYLKEKLGRQSEVTQQYIRNMFTWKIRNDTWLQGFYNHTRAHIHTYIHIYFK